MSEGLKDITDNDLVSLVQQGDQSAFNVLLSRHRWMIYNICDRFFAPGLMREDLHQAGYIGLYAACRKYNSSKGMSFWVFARMHIKHHIINDVVTALRKKRKILNQSISLDTTHPTSQGENNRYEIIPLTEPSPEEICINQAKDRELFEQLKKHLTTLERTAVLGLMDGMAYKEIAKLAGVGNKSIDNALARAKGKLKHLFYCNA